MTDQKNKIPLDVDHVHKLISSQATLVKKKLLDVACQKQYREKKKEKIISRVLRPIPKQTHYDDIVSSELNNIGIFNIAARMLRVKEKFRTLMAYNCKVGEGPYIIQFQHNNCWIDWLEVKKPSADQYGFGLFAIQDIEPN